MYILPAIDLYEKKAVRLYKGDYKEMTVYSENPVEVAMKFREAGAEFIHLVDLEGARDGGTPNFETIKEIIAVSGLKAEVGGGIRDESAVRKYIEAGSFKSNSWNRSGYRPRISCRDDFRIWRKNSRGH